MKNLAPISDEINLPDVSVVVVSWNTTQLLEECLSSITGGRPQLAEGNAFHVLVDGLRCEVVVVDNASQDGSPQMVHREFPWVRLIANRENLGFARACNQAFRLGRGRYLLMLNPDARLQPGALRTLVTFLDEHPQAGAAGAQILSADGSLQVSCYPAPSLSRELWRLFHLDRIHSYAAYDMEAWSTEEARLTDTVLGACMLVSRKAIQEIGPLDEDFFIYSEEVDLCLRLRQHGWEVYWVPQAKAVHHGGQSTRQVATEMFLRLYAAKVLYFRKHRGPFVADVYKLILAAAAMARILFAPACHADRRMRANRYRSLVKALGAF